MKQTISQQCLRSEIAEGHLDNPEFHKTESDIEKELAEELAKSEAKKLIRSTKAIPINLIKAFIIEAVNLNSSNKFLSLVYIIDMEALKKSADEMLQKKPLSF